MRFTLFATVVLWLAASPAAAHKGVAHEIAELNNELFERPDDLDLLQTRADLYRREGDFERAATDLRHAEKLAPGNPETALAWARLRVATRELAAAERYLDRYFDLGGTDPEAHALLATSLLGQGRAEGALLAFDAAIEKSADIDLYLRRARVQQSLGLVGQLLDGLEEGIHRTSAAILRLQLGRAALTYHQPARALEALTPLLQQARQPSAVLLLQAEAHQQLGNREQALELRQAALHAAQRLVDKRPSAMAFYERARARAALGDANGARADAGLAADKAPTWGPAKELLRELGGAR